MENSEKKEIPKMGKPQKFILHMAKYNDDWAGKAVSYEWDEECVFKSLAELTGWLRKHDEKSKK